MRRSNQEVYVCHLSPVVLLQSDPGTVKILIASLYKSFHSVRRAPSMGDLRSYLDENPKGVVIMDMEVASMCDVQHSPKIFRRSGSFATTV